MGRMDKIAWGGVSDNCIWMGGSNCKNAIFRVPTELFTKIVSGDTPVASLCE